MMMTGDYDKTCKRIMEILQEKELANKCLCCRWHTEGRSCVWPETMCQFARAKTRKNSEKK